MLTSRTEICVRYAETDMMGIAYHGNYLPWFEVGRTTLLKETGFPYLELERRGYRLPVLEVGARYLKPALYDDRLTIETTMKEKPSIRIRLDYRVLRGEIVLATGHSVHAFVSPEGQPVKPPPEFAETMTRIFSTRT